MSRRPGRIVEEIAIDIGQRHDPFVRRQDARVSGYVSRLMDKLEIGQAADLSSLSST
jgi:NitT/TauT family transport system ATP-binding protein